MTETIQQYSLSIGNKSFLKISLVKEANGLKVERELIEPSGSKQIQVWCFESGVELHRFLVCDEYFIEHKRIFEKIQKAGELWLRSMV
jgi:hypothetical protein